MTSLLSKFDISEDEVRRIVSETITGADDGELFLEYREGESLMFDNGRLKTANFNTDQASAFAPSPAKPSATRTPRISPKRR